MISLAVISLAAVGLGETSRRHKAADGNLWGLDRFRGGGLIRGPCARRACIALTFDDGPEHSTTPRVLDELDRRGVRATFFVVGRRFDGDGPIAERNREVLRDVWRRGHMVGNHTYTHPLMDRLDERSITREIERTDRVITETLGVRTFLFRAPYGAMQTPAARHAVYSRGLTPVFWAIDTRDWAAHSPEEVLANFRAGLDESPRGGVVLFHDTLPRTTQALPLVFDEIAARNEQRRTRGLPPYEFVGLDELWEPLRPSRAH
ncbi:MAG: polysaccharide deacetylase family protein [Deltaproteobacteria bacterium]|nr:polysaccharide deacetylase family protein [Deltaproteobacteria bacterium]